MNLINFIFVFFSMEHFFVYILKSVNNKFYIGQTKNLYDRLCRHNSNREKATKNKGPWEIVAAVSVLSGSEAVKLEARLKRMKNAKKANEFL